MDLDDYKEPIYFDNITLKWSVLSNFYPSKFMVDGKEYYHVEGYYQSQKFAGNNDAAEEHVRTTESPGLCKKIAWSYPLNSNEIREWNAGKRDRVMTRAILCKFSSNRHLLDMLLSSRNNILIESSKTDYYWACGKHDTGRNKLGEILMEVRGLLRGITHI